MQALYVSRLESKPGKCPRYAIHLKCTLEACRALYFFSVKCLISSPRKEIGYLFPKKKKNVFWCEASVGARGGIDCGDYNVSVK